MDVYCMISYKQLYIKGVGWREPLTLRSLKMLPPTRVELTISLRQHSNPASRDQSGGQPYMSFDHFY